MYIVDLRQSFSIPLVELFYKEVMEALFPVDDERDSLQFLVDGLSPHGPGLGEQEELHVLLAFANPDPKSGDTASNYEIVPYTQVPPSAKLAGAVCFEYYFVPNVSILTYVATLPAFRGRGIGGLFSRLVEGKSNEVATEYYARTRPATPFWPRRMTTRSRTTLWTVPSAIVCSTAGASVKSGSHTCSHLSPRALSVPTTCCSSPSSSRGLTASRCLTRPTPSRRHYCASSSRPFSPRMRATLQRAFSTTSRP